MPLHGTSPRGDERSEQPRGQALRPLRSAGEQVSGPRQTSDAGTAPSREALLQACASGDRAALQRLYQATAPQLFRIAIGIVRSRELAEDVVQDSFVLVWRHAHRFDAGRGAAMAWLACMVRNRCFDLLRRRGRETPLDATIMESWEDPAPNPADLTALSRDAQRLRVCLDQLAEGPRKSLLLAYYDGLTFEEVAGRLGRPSAR